MTLGKKRIVAQKSKNHLDIDNGVLGLGLEFSQYKREFGRERILKSSDCEIEDSIFPSPVRNISAEKLYDRTCVIEGQSQQSEDIPYDILTRVAKERHFTYYTPRHISVFDNGRISFDIEDNDNYEIEGPGETESPFKA